jgi:type I restriction enzyme S subunit
MSSSVPDGWRNETIGTYVEKMVGGAPLRPSDFSKTGVRVIPKMAVQFGGKTKFKVKTYCTTDFANNNQKNIVNNEYIITSLRDLVPTGPTIGVIGKLTEQGEFILAQGVYGLKIKNIIDDYLIQLSNSQWYRQEMRLIFVGSTQVHIRNQEFLDVVIPIPPLPEQQIIAQILTSVDEVIETTQAQIDKLKDLKTAMMLELLTKGIGHVEFKDSPVGIIPVGWEVRQLDDYLSYISYGFTNPMPESDVGPFMITAKDVKGLKIQYSSARKTTKIAFDDLLTVKSRPKRNDLLLTKDGTLGRVAIVDQDNICINQSVAVLRHNEKIIPKYLLYLLASPYYQREMLDKAGGSTIKHIYITIVDKMKVAVPDLAEQKKIVEILDSLLSKLESAEQKIIKYKNIKKALMQDLLTGKVRVNTEQSNSAYAVG